MKYELRCDHDNAVLVQEKTNAGTIYRCPKCHCVFRLMVANNDRDCWNKRFPPKKMVPVKQLLKVKKK